MENSKQNKVNNPISCLSGVDANQFKTNIDTMGLEDALKALMHGNSQLALEIHMIAGAYKGQDPNGPNPIEAIAEAVSNMPNEDSAALIVVRLKNKMFVRLKGKPETVTHAVIHAMSQDEELHGFLQTTMVINSIFNSMTSREEDPLSNLMGRGRNPMEDLMGSRSNPLVELMNLMRIADSLPDDILKGSKRRGPFHDGFRGK